MSPPRVHNDTHGCALVVLGVSDLTAPSQLAARVAELEEQISKLNGILRLLGFES